MSAVEGYETPSREGTGRMEVLGGCEDSALTRFTVVSIRGNVMRP